MPHTDTPPPEGDEDPFWDHYPGLSAPNYTMFPNELLDDLMPRLSDSEFKVVCALTRATLGWQQTSACLSLSDLAERTGLHRRSMMRAVKTLEQWGVISVHREQRTPTTSETNIYALRIMTGAEEHALWLRRNPTPGQLPLDLYSDGGDDPE